MPEEVASFLRGSRGPGGTGALEELEDVLGQLPKRRKLSYARSSSGTSGMVPLAPEAPLTATLKVAGRTRRYFRSTCLYLLELERQGWRCCRGYCLKDVDKRMIIARATIWGAKDLAQRRRDLMNLIAWCKVWAQDQDPHYELRLFGKPVCARAFACAHGERLRTFYRRRADVDAAIGDTIPRKVAFRPPRHRPGVRREDCSEWLRDTLSVMAQPLPNKTVTGPDGEERTREFLPSGMFSTLNDVYQYYCGHVLAQPDSCGEETRPASFQTFRRAWLANYFQVSGQLKTLPQSVPARPSHDIDLNFVVVGAVQIRPYRHALFSKCDQCVMFAQLRGLVDDQHAGARGELEAKRDRHLAYVNKARDRMRERAEHARRHCDDVLMINIDGMDQAKTNVPNEPLKDKAGSVGAPLVVKLMGAIAYGRAWYGFWSLPQWGSNSNTTLTAISRIIRQEQEDGKRRGRRSPYLPPRLILQMDNTGKDNKNHYLVGFAGMLLSEGLFQEVEAHFLPVGHTHQEIDQSFSLVSKALKRHGALDVVDLMDVASKAWTNLDYVGATGKTNVLLEVVHDYRRALRYVPPRKNGTVGQHGEDDGEDDGKEERNMHSFKGLGTERKGNEDDVSKR